MMAKIHDDMNCDSKIQLINSLTPSDAYMRQYNIPT